ncbi:MAG TPA: DNA mismatch repair endonuclease MutL [Cytophagaceae bacterium]|jgi:DNA mismatch repair protein MutL|nr:DNA mismatch repair endonuclease MutL [Cytophagaceae bacterium]
MSDIIRLLPDSIANQIAAGEVVQRPASAVKELLENSIDAGSTKIQLVVKDAGKQLIQIIDNGVGMSVTDARMSFERHATSKIRRTEDLFTIKTFGFRGEAIPSIAAVAQVEMKTRKGNEELGTHLKVEGSEIKLQESVACEKGTSIAVKNLFYNIPARRNFLKSNPVELKHILDEFQRVSLAHPEIEFSFYQNDLETYSLKIDSLPQRIVDLFGKGYREQLISCKEDTDFIKIKGFIGKPEFSKKSRGEQFFFVNNRFIKSSYLNHAVMFAYDNLIGNDAFPFYVLFIEIDPKYIDINVHPTKTEIKFEDEKTVYAMIRAAVKKSLATHNIAPSIDYELDINFNIPAHQRGSTLDKFPNELSGKSISYTPQTTNQHWDTLYKGFENKENLEKIKHYEEMTLLTLESKINTADNGIINKDLLYSDNTTTFQLHQKYIVTQIKSGMALIDQQAAHERILYEKYLNMLQNKFGASQQFLFPQSIELSPNDFALLMEMEEEIKSLGFVYNIFGKNTIVVNGIPADIPNANEKNLFESLIEQYKQNQTELRLEKKENLARALAKRSAIRQGTKLSLTEMNSLIDQLFACKMPTYAPNGNLTLVLMTTEKIAAMFHKSE